MTPSEEIRLIKVVATCFHKKGKKKITHQQITRANTRPTDSYAQM